MLEVIKTHIIHKLVHNFKRFLTTVSQYPSVRETKDLENTLDMHTFQREMGHFSMRTNGPCIPLSLSLSQQIRF